MKMADQLLPPSKDQKYVTVSALAGGFLTAPDHVFIHPATEGAMRTVPSLTFLITHPGTKMFGSDGSKSFRMMFDLGLRRSKDLYPEVLQKHLEHRAPFDLEPGIAAQLRMGGLDPSMIELVLLSHVHYDHHGDPEDFPVAQFRVGFGAMGVLKHGLGGVASHQHFDPDMLPEERSEELPDPKGPSWKPLGPFPAVLDLFQDGSVYIIDTPGHLPGHINALCRLKDRWICLCGDAFHDRRLLTGEKEIATWEGPHGLLCIHVDKEAAAESIRRLRKFGEMVGDGCDLLGAHDEFWWEKNKSRAFPKTI